ncbi:hypothetical protein SPRG_12729 [Saprolegnia parasitica CBS 223.65]|uniref:Uncharacterized protein n=1 Tax=Saprolegnia parasitica (strain CBS 223.65) TaxID=695850 RepID=A0A067BVY7_SAPPC|nr:hypothetical protein SPRG_12729 [Saprolegnia parasitica CBS 223.65]KDO22448.1 hypothetical protein SPRG_12729 [Saprolegnia parasitica CBS 223.65]|eukprot:XP_012206836.1 hypothetical protein SPRG_12729 [Saprolegnia parasitica CBS 223.65]
MAGRSLQAQLFDKTPEQLSLNQRLELDPDLDELELELAATDASEADQQVLVMSETIDLLRRHLETQRKELQAAYRTLHEYETKTQSERSKALATESQQASADQQLRDLAFTLELKNVALHEATMEKESMRIELQKYKALTRELSERLERTCVPTATTFTTSNNQSNNVSGLNQASVHSAASNQSGHVPKRDRFDHIVPASIENRDDFWKLQWKEAMRARKGHPTTIYNQFPDPPPKQPTLKIFSSPPHGKRGFADRDERFPVSRYIGINSRQSALIKECYKVVGNTT